MSISSAYDDDALPLRRKIRDLNWLLVLLLVAIACVGFAMLYSAANGSMTPWASRQMIRFGVGLVLMFALALSDIRLWIRYAYVIYLGALLLLMAVEVMGVVGMGARRWVDLGVFQLQPSEVMKIALVLALARFYHGLAMEDVPRLRMLLPPLVMIALPSVLVLRQPDLGTTVLLVMTAGAIIFSAGVRLWKFALAGGLLVAAVPLAWRLMLHDYQRQRVLTFLNPENDPLGSGYHIIQSKIAFGSGGLFGKGFLQGTQSHLNFLPEMQTDFIFTMLAEEFGMAGGLALLGLYVVILIYGLAISVRCRTQFGRLVGIGVTATFFLYVFINIGMVIGLMPVVGVPLPLVSFGGTSMVTLMAGFGILMSIQTHRKLISN